MIRHRDGATSLSTSAKNRIVDEEFGVVTYRRSALAKYVRIRVTEDGIIRASLPKRAPLYLIHELLDSSRIELRKLVESQRTRLVQYVDGMTIGHSHRLHIAYSEIDVPSKKVVGQDVYVSLPSKLKDSVNAHEYISTQVRRALRREAMAYLPRRLRYLADQFGFDYERERFGNQRGRWGSCSSSGTISLNVALMNIPHDLIDYVLIHELSHTKQMNHSTAFWEIVEECMPNYKQRRKLLKTMSPIC